MVNRENNQTHQEQQPIESLQDHKPEEDAINYGDVSTLINTIEADSAITVEEKISIIVRARDELNEKMDILRAQAAGDKAKIVEARTVLGLDEEYKDATNQEHYQMARIQKQLEALTELENKISGQKQEGEKWQEEEFFIKGDVAQLVDSLNGLVVTLRERNSEGLNPLIYEDGINLIMFSAGQLKNSIEKNKIDVVEIESAMQSLLRATKGFGEPRSSVMADTTESLDRVYFNLGQVIEPLMNLKSKIGQSDNETVRELSGNIIKVINSLDEVYGFIGKKRRLLEEYLDGRY